MLTIDFNPIKKMSQYIDADMIKYRYQVLSLTSESLVNSSTGTEEESFIIFGTSTAIANTET